MQLVLTTYGSTLLAMGCPSTMEYKVGTGTGYSATSQSLGLSGTMLASGTTADVDRYLRA